MYVRFSQLKAKYGGTFVFTVTAAGEDEAVERLVSVLYRTWIAVVRLAMCC